MDNRDKRNTTILYISVSLCLLLYLSTYLLNTSKESTITEKNNTHQEPINETQPIKPKKKRFIQQPTTHISAIQKMILNNIIETLQTRKQLCTPEDFNNEEKHKMPKIASKTVKMSEPRAVLVVYIAMGLLLTSLGAALFDFFRAKSELKSPDVGKKKPPMTRKCSLADLTVLRHSRKESMRKDSIYEGNSSAQVIGRKVSRPPLRLD